jgi:hypothetical protein
MCRISLMFRPMYVLYKVLYILIGKQILKEAKRIKEIAFGKCKKVKKK